MEIQTVTYNEAIERIAISMRCSTDEAERFYGMAERGMQQWRVQEPIDVLAAFGEDMFGCAYALLA